MIAYYFDEMMPRATANGLIERGIDVIMAVDVDMTGKDDDTEHLPYATENNRVLVTLDRPFAGRTTARTDHGGLICWTGDAVDFGAQIRALETFSRRTRTGYTFGSMFWFIVIGAAMLWWATLMLADGAPPVGCLTLTSLAIVGMTLPGYLSIHSHYRKLRMGIQGILASIMPDERKGKSGRE
jgi:hypothetical protein